MINTLQYVLLLPAWALLYHLQSYKHISDWRAAQLPRQMHTYHTHFGTPLGSESGWWDDEKQNKKPVLPHYIRLDDSHKALRSLSCPRLSGHKFQVQIQRYNQGLPYEQRV